MPYDRRAADRYCNFFEHILKFTTDEWFGQPFTLAPWQREALCSIFGEQDEQGRRCIQDVYLEVPKKSGKTEFCAGIILAMLFFRERPGYHVYGTAAAQRQAANVYRAACKMVEQSPLLSSVFLLRRSTYRILRRDDLDSFYVAVAADGDFTDGVNPAVVVADEIHRYRTRKMLENWDVLAQGGLARKQPLTIAITTAGVKDESPLAWRRHEKTKKIEAGVLIDPSFYGRVYGADQDDDWTSPATWIKANPSLKQNGGFLDIEVYAKKCAAAQGDAEEEITFKRYLRNVWEQKARRAIQMDQWQRCAQTFVAAPLGSIGDGDLVRPLSPAMTRHFVDRPCWIGVDLSLSTDMSAVVAVFPSADGGTEWVPFFFMPNDGLKKKERRDGVPYTRWAREGWIETHDGTAIDYGQVRQRILWCTRMFDVKDVCFDRFNSREMSVDLGSKHGIPVCEIPQTFGGLSEAFKRLLGDVAIGTMHHGGNPVLDWQASCVDLKDDGNDNIRPVKPNRAKDSSRIDGITAGLNAMARLIVAVEKKSEWTEAQIVV